MKKGETAQATIERLEAELKEVRRVLSDQQLSNAKALEEVTKRDTQLEELRKEARFMVELSRVWVEQLRKALGEAMDALAADPDHDISLQARLEMTRRAVDCTKGPIPMECLSCHKVSDDVAPYCSKCYMDT